MKKILKKINKKKGITILFASLVVSALLSIALSLVSISLNQFLLASSSRESQSAFYAADSGLECAIYHELKSPFHFATSTDNNSKDLYCGSDPAKGIKNYPVPPSTSAATTTYKFNINNNNSFCSKDNPSFEIMVEKYKDVSNNQKTTIRVRGYNICDTTNPNRIERGFKINY